MRTSASTNQVAQEMSRGMGGMLASISSSTLHGCSGEGERWRRVIRGKPAATAPPIQKMNPHACTRPAALPHLTRVSRSVKYWRVNAFHSIVLSLLMRAYLQAAGVTSICEPQ